MKLLMTNERLKQTIASDPDDVEVEAGSLAALMENSPEEFWKWFSKEIGKSNTE